MLLNLPRRKTPGQKIITKIQELHCSTVSFNVFWLRQEIPLWGHRGEKKQVFLKVWLNVTLIKIFLKTQISLSKLIREDTDKKKNNIVFNLKAKEKPKQKLHTLKFYNSNSACIFIILFYFAKFT